MSNVFFINMPKNIGKRLWIKDIAKNLSGTIWNGIDKNIYDKKGVLLQTLKQEEY